VLVAAFVFVSSDPPVVLFGLFVVYGLSGWGVLLWRLRKAKQLSFRRAGNDPPARHTDRH
jgi:CDP-diacylglycerol--serine O-phosphatidyltransferase